MGGLSMLCSSSVLKEFDSVMGEVEKRELEKLGKPQPSQIHETLLLTNPAYKCVKDPIQLTWYQPACSDLSQQLSHWMPRCPHLTAFKQITQGYLGQYGPGLTIAPVSPHSSSRRRIVCREYV